MQQATQVDFALLVSLFLILNIDVFNMKKKKTHDKLCDECSSQYPYRISERKESEHIPHDAKQLELTAFMACFLFIFTIISPSL